MKKSDFYFELPKELIAQFPLAARSDSRMLVYQRATGTYEHRGFADLLAYINPGDLLVFNDSRVIPARLFGQKASGGRVEIMVERVIAERECLAQIRASKTPRPGTQIHLDADWILTVVEKQQDLYHCLVSGDVVTMLDAIGHMPLPPYIQRQDQISDAERYQTIYAKHRGSVAAPTAGLHFDALMLERIKAKGIAVAYTTLHVGAGTYQPVRCEDIADHHMHSEWFTISPALCDAVAATKAGGGRVIAVGSTALRSLESAVVDGQLQPCARETSIFITPGYRFKICDGLLTNFHLPESTLLMMVSAFIGYDQTMNMYRIAIEQGYRFFSYGDVSLLL